MSRFRGILAGQTDNRVSGRSRPTRQIQRHLSENEVISLVRAHALGDTIDELATTFDIHRAAVMAHWNAKALHAEVAP